MGPGGTTPPIHEVCCLSSLLFFCSLQLSAWRGFEKKTQPKRQTRRRCMCRFLLVVADSKTAMFVEKIGRIQTLIQPSNMRFILKFLYIASNLTSSKNTMVFGRNQKHRQKILITAFQKQFPTFQWVFGPLGGRFYLEGN